MCVSIKAKRRLLKSIEYQFPVAATLKKWGILPSDKCRLCKKVAPDKQPVVETIRHIQRYCPALKLIRIAIHHGFWRQLLRSIKTLSTRKKEDNTDKKWNLPSASSEVSHIQCDLRKILQHMNHMTNDLHGCNQLKELDIQQSGMVTSIFPHRVVT